MAKKVCDYKKKYSSALIMLNESYQQIYNLNKYVYINLRRMFEDYPQSEEVLTDIKNLDLTQKVNRKMRKEIEIDINSIYQ